MARRVTCPKPGSWIDDNGRTGKVLASKPRRLGGRLHVQVSWAGTSPPVWVPCHKLFVLDEQPAELARRGIAFSQVTTGRDTISPDDGRFLQSLASPHAHSITTSQLLEAGHTRPELKKLVRLGLLLPPKKDVRRFWTLSEKGVRLVKTIENAGRYLAQGQAQDDPSEPHVHELDTIARIFEREGIHEGNFIGFLRRVPASRYYRKHPAGTTPDIPSDAEVRHVLADAKLRLRVLESKKQAPPQDRPYARNLMDVAPLPDPLPACRPGQFVQGRGYCLPLTEEEIEALRYISGRYSWADAVGNALDSEEPGEHFIRESDAWTIKEAIDAQDGWLPLAGGTLKEKIEAFYNAIH